MIHNLGEAMDAKGIRMKVTHNDHTMETVVIVWHGEKMMSHTFRSNRFGFHLGDSLRAMQIADLFAARIERELGLQ